MIFEDENEQSPYYKLENYSQYMLVCYVQEGFDAVNESERLLPNHETAYAFIDPKLDHAISVIQYSINLLLVSFHLVSRYRARS